MEVEYKDRLGNVLKEGDEVLVLVPKSQATWRRATIIAFKKNLLNSFEIYVEYINDRLYSDEPWYTMRDKSTIKFRSKPSRIWRWNSDVVKLKPEYIGDDC